MREKIEPEPFATRLKLIRANTHLSRKQFAISLGVSPYLLMVYETAKVDIVGPELINAVLTAYPQISRDWLLYGQPPAPFFTRDNSGSGSRLKMLRNNMGLTSEEFGKPLGLSRYVIRRFEKGNVPEEVGIKIAEVYGVNVEWLLFGDGTPPENTTPLQEETPKTSEPRPEGSGKRLQLLIEHLDMTASTFASSLSLPAAKIHYSLKHGVTRELAGKITTVYDISADWLLDGTGTPPPLRTRKGSGKRLKEVRAHYGIFAKDLAERIGITATTLSYCETQDRVSMAVAEAVEKEFGVNKAWLLYGEGEGMIGPPKAIRRKKQRGIFSPA